MSLKADDTGCSFKCVSHQTFGLEIGELLTCSKCKFVDEVQNVHLDFFINLYASELISL